MLTILRGFPGHMRDHFQTKALIQQMKGSWEDFAMGLVQLAMDLNFAMGLVQLAMGLVQLAMDLAQLQHFRKHLHLACQNPVEMCHKANLGDREWN